MKLKYDTVLSKKKPQFLKKKFVCILKKTHVVTNNQWALS